MLPADLDAVRRALVAARRDARAIGDCPPDWRPADLDEAYRLQAAVIDELGGGSAWKVGAITPEQQRAMGVAQPVAAVLPAVATRDASGGAARLQLGRFIAPKIECEFAFELGSDLPPRPGAPYARAEVSGAIAAMRLAIEIVDPRWPAGSGTLAEVADDFNNGAFVVGRAVRDWARLDFDEIRIVLTFTAPGGTASELALGSGHAILDGDPFGAVVMLANAQPASGPSLRKGDVVTTGSCTGAPRLPGPGLYRADYAGLGSVELQVDA